VERGTLLRGIRFDSAHAGRLHVSRTNGPRSVILNRLVTKRRCKTLVREENEKNHKKARARRGPETNW
jgi:hypothetical protein